MEAEPIKAEPPKRKRRWFQFSLRTLLIFTVVVAVTCGWLGNKIEQKRRQQAAAEAIVKLGGELYYDYERVKGQPGHWQPSGAVPFGPPWLRAVLGDTFFSDVDCIYCLGGLDNLKEFPHLHTLRLMSFGVTDDGLKDVKVLTELRDLALIDTKVSDAGAEDLHKALPKCYIAVIHQLPPYVSRKDYPPAKASE